jgi:hypothetical protein
MTPEETELRLQRIEGLLAETVAIANSNARAIEASTNEGSENRRLAQQTQTQLMELARIVGQFAQATNSRLEILENK